ncbi:unnamed protein product [Xylocopa violacea]|uniref:Nucleolar 27S pre-rRNA processing Urb2/Npa2 C-terminal domain-containing protein n=1 Tax=Xylocopa violacea TaxID=135666 RepID=A0ABP1P0R6_XYLVO
MALSVELQKRLNSNEEPLPKRIKLAENAFYAVDVPIVHKEDLILRWLCRTCPTEPTVWNSLKNCLKIQNLNIKTDLNKIITEVLVATFENDIQYLQEDIFECCRLLISNNKIQQYYISKPEYLGALMESLLKCVYKIFEHAFDIDEQATKGIDILLINERGGLILTAYNTVISAVENIIQIFKSAFTKDNLRNTFIYYILYPLCAIIDHNRTDNTNKLGVVTHKCIQQLIFGRKYTQSGEFLIHEDIKALENLLSTLTEYSKTKNLQSNIMTFTFFFRVAINTFKTDTTLLDIVLRELIECSEAHKKDIFNSLLKHLNDVTFNFDNKIHNVTLFDYCQNIIDNILVSKDISNVDYDLLAQFCYFNPLIVERRIQDILKKVFVEKSTLKYKNLMISMLDASVHLRQEEKLISSILIALRDCLMHVSTTESNMFFPNEFKEKLMETINNITHSQSVVMLRTLTYHLKTDCLEVLHCNDTYGISIFECRQTSTFYKKFINAFDDLKNVLSLIMEKILCINHDEKTTLLLTAIYSWNEMKTALSYYMPTISSENLGFPISENQWHKLIKRIKKHGSENSKNNMNKLILQQIKMSQNTLNKCSMMLNILIDDLEYCWYLIFEYDAKVLSMLGNEDISKLTYLLLIDMASNADNCNKWINILHRNDLHEDKRFIISLLNSIFTQVGHLSTENVSKSIGKYFNIEILLEAETVESEKINNILMSIKQLFTSKWIQIKDIFLREIEVYLNILLHLPLMFLSSNLRLITFMFIFALRMECDQSNEIVSSCNTIFSDLMERHNIGIFQYLDPFLLLQQVPQSKNFQKVLEVFLRNCSYTILKKLVKYSMQSNKNIFFLLESIEHIKSKLNTDQKIIIKKAERKLIKIAMKILSFKTTTNDIKILNLILRIKILQMKENIDEKLKNITESIIQDIFVNNVTKDTHKVTNELLQDGLQLIIIIFRNKKMFQITDKTVKGVWYALFKHPCIDVLLPLLESSEPKEFSEFLEELHNQLVKAVLNVQENDLKTICIIWNAVLKTNMSNDRSKLRLIAINNLIQTIQAINIPTKFWPNLVKVIQEILITKHLYLPGYIIDMSIILGFKSLEENTILTCNDTLALCNVLLKVRTNLITDRIPSLLVLYKRILSITVHKSKVIIEKSEEHSFRCLALNIEKFTSVLIKLKKDMIRISPYLVADLLELFSESSVPSFVKTSIQNCINQLISICDQHGIALLSRTLPVSMQEIFRTQLDVYNKFHKFSGKI